MTTRRSSREIPPERKTMGDPCISVLFDMSGCGCGQYIGMVLSN